MGSGVRPFDDIRSALRWLDDSAGPPRAEPGDERPAFRLDPGRTRRTGIPEVVYAGHKRPDEVVDALARQAERVGRALASRCGEEAVAAARARLDGRFDVAVDERARTIVVARPGVAVEPTGGRVGVLCAGTSDLPIAAEAAVMAREMGAAVEEAWDVGVAGLHRLVAPLEQLVANGVDALVVAAGMDGALPSVVAGLVPVPVIGLPTAVGYGFGGGGVGALTTMLQSCAPGLVVVNIDNGIGAGATAALIANRVAAARSGSALRLGLIEASEEIGDDGGGGEAARGDVGDGLLQPGQGRGAET